MEFVCPHCHWLLRIPDAYTGETALCGNCQFHMALSDVSLRPDSDSAGVPSTKRRQQVPPPSHGDSGPRFATQARPLASGTSEGVILPHRGGLLLALAIAGWIVLPFLSPVVWIMGRGDLRQMSHGRMDAHGHGITSAATIVAMLHCVVILFALAVVAVVLFAIGVSHQPF